MVPGGNNLEAALDIGMAISMAPGLAQFIVDQGPAWMTSWTASPRTIRPGDQLLLGLVAPRFHREADFPAVPGVRAAFFEASGDNGAY